MWVAALVLLACGVMGVGLPWCSLASWTGHCGWRIVKQTAQLPHTLGSSLGGNAVLSLILLRSRSGVSCGDGRIFSSLAVAGSVYTSMAS